MYSQYGEDEFILAQFSGRTGTFLDIGAYDGLTFSNTRCLMERGWAGVCVEPNPMVFPYLMENTKQFPKVELINAAIGEPGLIDFWACQDCYSTQLYPFQEKIHRHNRKIEFRKIQVSAVPWSAVVGIHTIDFVNIDVEGLNLGVLSSMWIRPEMLCVELDPQHCIPGIKAEVQRKGYHNTREVGGNLLAWL